MNKICNPQKVFNCNICNTKYSSKSSLCNHNRIKHNVTLLCNNTGIMENLIKDWQLIMSTALIIARNIFVVLCTSSPIVSSIDLVNRFI